MKKQNRKEEEVSNTRSKVSRSGRMIYFFDTVDEDSVLEAIKHVHHLDMANPKAPITLLIDSVGGNCYDGLALYDCLRMCRAPVVTVGYGIVASMGFIIFLAGDKRVSAPNTRFLNHQVSSEIAGKATDIEIQRAEIVKLENLTVSIVSERTGMPEAKIKKDVKLGDNYYSAKEAMKKGIVHQIMVYTDKSNKNTTILEVKPKE